MKKTAEDLMNGHVIYIKASDDLALAWKVMQDNSLRHLVVVDDNHDLAGILSDRDCLRAVRSHSYASGRGRIVESTFPPGVTVNDYMRAPVRTVEYDTTADQIAELMNEFKISSVVVHAADQVIGIITEYDLLRDYAEMIRRQAG